MNHKFSHLIVCWLAIFLISKANAQSSFRNLDFEEANLSMVPTDQFIVSASDALPGWTIYGGFTYPDVLFNTQALDLDSISIWATTDATVWASGRYYIQLKGNGLFPEPFLPAIAQVGQIPDSAVTLLLDGYYSPQVKFEGIDIPMVEIGPRIYNSFHAFGSVYGGDISAFAGQVGELRFSGGQYFDDIRFSTQPIPEPETLALFVMGLGLFYHRFRTLKSNQSVEQNRRPVLRSRLRHMKISANHLLTR